MREALALDDTARREMGARGRVWMDREYRWDAIAAAFAGLYRWAAHGGPPPACITRAHELLASTG